MNRYLHTGDWANPDKMLVRLKADGAANPGVIVTASLGPWSICYSTGVPQLGTMLSAKATRSTSKRDWQILGRIGALSGAPEGMMPDTIATDASATHYWIWGNDPEVQPLVDTMMGKKPAATN